jgi:hypothetical protein
MKPYVCVTELYEHMMTESEKLQRGTVHAEDWLFEHGAALKLMQQPLGNCRILANGINLLLLAQLVAAGCVI